MDLFERCGKRSGKVERMVGELIWGPAGTLDRDSSDAERWEVMETLHNPPIAFGQQEGDTDELPGIILGEDLANALGVYPGSRLKMLNPGATQPTVLGMQPPPVMYYRVAGIFDSGMYEYDTKWAYVTMEDAQKVLRLGQIQGDVVTGIEVMAEDIREAGNLADDLEPLVDPWMTVDSWEEMNQSLFSALKLEKIAMGLILSLIVVVASLNIVGSLILVVVTRAREISIMRAMGASTLGVRTVFMLEGLVIGVVGTVLGTTLGLLGCMGLKRYEFPLDTDVYFLDTLPVVVEPWTVATVAGSALLISFLATLYPAGLAARLDPVEGLRYE